MVARVQYEQWAREILRCPTGGHRLVDVVDSEGQPGLQCAQDCGEPGQRRRYPVRHGIPVLLAGEAVIVTAGPPE